MNETHKKYLFYVFTVLIPLLFIVLVETSARIISPAQKDGLFVEKAFDGIAQYQTNRAYLDQFFPASAASVPEFKPALVYRDKPENLFRIVCLGGSSMFGTPYQMTGNITGILRRQLRHVYPEKEFEVLNLAASAINSSVIAELAPLVTDLDPDLVLVYMGHNEFYGPGGVGAPWLQKKLPFVYELASTIMDLRSAQLLAGWFTQWSAGNVESVEKNLMRQVSEQNRVRLDSDDANRIFNNFEANLSNIIETFKARDIPVMISTIASNLMFQPFAADSLINGEAASSIRRQFNSLVFKKQYRQAGEMLAPYLEGIDSAHAMLNYLAGMIHHQNGDYAGAREYLVRAKDNDLLKFRAPEMINKIIRETAREQEVPLIDAHVLLKQNSSHGITGYDLFWEHLHPSLEGYYLIAGACLDKIVTSGLVGANPQASPYMLHTDSLAVCWLDLAFADLLIDNLTSHWPFRDFNFKPRALQLQEEPLQRIALAVFQRKMTWDEGCYKIAEQFEKEGRVQAAITTYHALLEEYPYNFYSNYLLARLYKQAGNMKEALKHYRISVEGKPDFVYANLDLGLIEINLGLFEEALKHLSMAQKSASTSGERGVLANIYYGMAAAYANKGDTQQAIQYVDEAITLLPSYESAIKLRARIRQAANNLN